MLKMTTGQRIRQESRQRGRAEGRAEGQAATLLRLLTRRFGPLPGATCDRITAATQQDLDRWTDRILDAKALADVFGDS